MDVRAIHLHILGYKNIWRMIGQIGWYFMFDYVVPYMDTDADPDPGPKWEPVR
jgi:hypothetical protein